MRRIRERGGAIDGGCGLPAPALLYGNGNGLHLPPYCGRAFRRALASSASRWSDSWTCFWRYCIRSSFRAFFLASLRARASSVASSVSSLALLAFALFAAAI